MADVVLDCSGLSCPMPIVKATKGAKGLESGQTMEITATDPAFEADIKAWSNKTGNEIESITQDGDKIIALIKKA